MKQSLLDPQSRLFFSVDLVNSTASKQRGDEGAWRRKFLSFYRDFPRYLFEQVDQLSESIFAKEDRVEFTFWKAVGDELLYSCRVDSAAQTVLAVEAWLRAQDAYEEQAYENEFNKQPTKGGVFSATFPHPDLMVAVPVNPRGEAHDEDVLALNHTALQKIDSQSCGRNVICDESGSYILDYLGPSLDTGFRVVSYATENLFTMSVEVTAALMDGLSPRDSDRSRSSVQEDTALKVTHISVLHSQSLKGIWDERPYPIFCIKRG
jgi:hypothetical protein